MEEQDNLVGNAWKYGRYLLFLPLLLLRGSMGPFENQSKGTDNDDLRDAFAGGESFDNRYGIANSDLDFEQNRLDQYLNSIQDDYKLERYDITPDNIEDAPPEGIGLIVADYNGDGYTDNYGYINNENQLNLGDDFNHNGIPDTNLRDTQEGIYLDFGLDWSEDLFIAMSVSDNYYNLAYDFGTDGDTDMRVSVFNYNRNIEDRIETFESISDKVLTQAPANEDVVSTLENFYSEALSLSDILVTFSDSSLTELSFTTSEIGSLIFDWNFEVEGVGIIQADTVSSGHQFLFALHNIHIAESEMVELDGFSQIREAIPGEVVSEIGERIAENPMLSIYESGNDNVPHLYDFKAELMYVAQGNKLVLYKPEIHMSLDSFGRSVDPTDSGSGIEIHGDYMFVGKDSFLYSLLQSDIRQKYKAAYDETGLPHYTLDALGLNTNTFDAMFLINLEKIIENLTFPDIIDGGIMVNPDGAILGELEVIQPTITPSKTPSP